MVSGSNGNAVKVVEDVLSRSIGLGLDAALFDVNPSISETRPAGLRFGIAALTASASTDATEAMLADVATVVAAVAPIAGNSPIVLVANPVRAMMLQLKTPRALPVTVLASSTVAPADLIAIVPSAIASAFDSVPEVSASYAAAIHQDNTPTDIGTVGGVAAPVISLCFRPATSR